MSARDWLDKNPTVSIVIVVAVLSLSVLTLLFALGFFGDDNPATSSKFHFYDMDTKELFIEEASLVPPIKAPSGGEGVIAQVYDCGDCAGGHYVALLKKYTPKAKNAIENDLPPPASGELIRLPDENSQWVPADSDAAGKMRLDAAAAVREFCKDKKPSICFPE